MALARLAQLPGPLSLGSLFVGEGQEMRRAGRSIEEEARGIASGSNAEANGAVARGSLADAACGVG